MVAQSILLLNASYEPLTVVTLARAVKLLLRGDVLSLSKGRAEAVSAEHVTVASAAQTLAAPQVLRPQYLRSKIYAHVPHRRTPAWTRHGVFERDDYTCAYCATGATLRTPSRWITSSRRRRAEPPPGATRLPPALGAISARRIGHRTTRG